VIVLIAVLDQETAMSNVFAPSAGASSWLGRRPTPLFCAVVGSLLLAACGGGGGSAGTETGPTLPPTGNAATTYVQGPVSGFGSVIVGGVRFDDSQAKVVDEDGTSQSLSAVKLGSMVQVDAGALNATDGTAVASQFKLGRELVGPVGTVDKTASTVQVLGQTVVVNASTVFDSTLSGGLSALIAGAVIEVHGIADPVNGTITATRIEPKATPLAYQLRGVVAALDSVAKTFKIGGALISYAGVPAEGVPVNLANGLVVRTLLKLTQVNGAWVAIGVSNGLRKPEGNEPPRDARVEGVISAFTSSAAFEVNGLKVDASKATFPDGTTALVLGARVEVTGSVVAGVLVATKVQLDKPEGGGGGGGNPRPLELHGAISALDGTAKTFVLRNITVSYSGTVVYKNGTATDLANAKNVDFYGVLSADRTRVQAQRIEFKTGG
jgi:Domain of unknown function (DUF5666)